MKKFYVKDCPENMAVHDWILKSTDLDYYVKNMKPNFKSDVVVKFSNPLIDLDKRLLKNFYLNNENKK